MPSRTFNRISSVFLLVLGGAFLFVEHSSTLAPKNQLTVISGRATNISTSTVYGRYGQHTDFVEFTINGVITQYGSNSPRYASLVEAIRNNQPLTLGMAKHKATLTAKEGWLLIYCAYVGTHPLFTYEDTVADSKKHQFEMEIASWACIVGGIVGLVIYRNPSKRSACQDRTARFGPSANFVGPRVPRPR